MGLRIGHRQHRRALDPGRDEAAERCPGFVKTGVQNAPSAAQSALGGSDIVTGPQPSGRMVAMRCALSRATRRMRVVCPPVTCMALRIARLFIPAGASLNTI